MSTKIITAVCFLVAFTVALSIALKAHMVTSYQLNSQDVFLQDSSR